MPLSPAPRGGACWGGHILTGPPRCISVCPASFLSPTLRQSHQGIWAGNRGCISRCRLFWSRVSQMARPRPPPPSSSITSSTPPSRPQILHLAHHHPLTPCTTLPCILAPDAIVGQTVCGYLPVTSGTVDDPPLPPPSSPRRPPARAWMGPSLNPGKDILQSAICNLRPPGRHRSAW